MPGGRAGEGPYGRAGVRQRRSRPRCVSLHPELGLEFLKRDRVAWLAHRRLCLGGVLGVLGRAESVENRFRDDGGHPLAANGEVRDDATTSQLNRLLDGRAADWKITRWLVFRTFVVLTVSPGRGSNAGLLGAR